MSWSVNSSSLPISEQERLRKSLYLVPKEEKGEPLLCIDSNKNQLLLPFSFGKRYFSKQHNRPQTGIKFIGTPRVEQLIPLKEAEKALDSGSCLLNFSTGFGKTFCALYLACASHKIICIVYPLLTLQKQWKKSINEYSIANVWINGEKMEQNIEDIQIILTTPGKIDKIPPELLSRIGFLIVDEAHMFCTNLKYKNLLQIEPSYCLALTATIEKEEHLLCGLKLMFGKIISHESIKNVTILRFNTGIKLPSIRNYTGREDWAALCRNTAFHKERNKEIVKYLVTSKEKILVLTSLVIHAKLLYNLCKEQEKDVSLLIKKDKDYSDSRILISTAKKSGVGFDDENFCSNYSGQRFGVLFLTFSLKSVLFLKQLVGRVFRTENPIIIEFVDDHYVVRNHAKQREKYYLEKNYALYSYAL